MAQKLSIHSGFEFKDKFCRDFSDDDDDDEDDDIVGLLLAVDFAVICASIACFDKSCDGHSKWTQWKI